MAIIKCKMCGGDLEILEDSSVCECAYCGTRQTVPSADNEKKLTLFNRAGRLLRSCEFDKAAGVFETIVADFPEEAEAYWGLVLCKYGIEYVDDPATGKKIPTCHRSSFDSLMDDANFEMVMEYSDAVSRRVYRDEAKQIEELRKGIIEVSSKEEPYDIFISYKELDDNGERTIDSVIAQDIYTELTEKGYRVFFSRISLEDKLGVEYEPYIFAALNSAKVMIVVGTDYDHFNAVWVKNEWSRFLSLIASGQKKTLIPVFKDIDAYDMPKEFSKLAALNWGKVGAMQDLVRGVEKLLGKRTEEKTVVRESAPVISSTAPLLKRAFMFLEDGEWKRADDFCEQVLNQNPENAQAYLGKLMAELHVREQEALADCEKPFMSSSNYQKAIRFGDEKLSSALKEYNNHIVERNKTARLTEIYIGAVNVMNGARTEAAYKSAAAKFGTISGFKDADALGEKCLEKAEVCRKDAIYASAKALMNGERTDNYESAIREFSRIPGWKDTDEQVYACQRKIEEIKANEETERLEKERKEEERRIAAESAEKKRKKTIAIVIPAMILLIVATTFIVKAITVSNSNKAYNNAIALFEEGQYEEAIAAFEALNGYKDSVDLAGEARLAENERIKAAEYKEAERMLAANEFDAAIEAFSNLGNYSDSKQQMNNAIVAKEEAENASKYEQAAALAESGEYYAAFQMYSELKNYKNAGQLAFEIKNDHPFACAEIGDIVFFGTYEQDNDLNNGQEPIEWIVIGESDNELSLYSRYCLDVRPISTSLRAYKWEETPLYKWLNDTFFHEAFNKSEVAALTNPVSLLSAYMGNGLPDNAKPLMLTNYAMGISSEIDIVWLAEPVKWHSIYTNESFSHIGNYKTRALSYQNHENPRIWDSGVDVEDALGGVRVFVTISREYIP